MTLQLRLLVGTRKGAFIYTSDEHRYHWELSAPMMAGWSVYHMSGDAREGHSRLYAAANHEVWGPSVSKSDDGGETWTPRSSGLRFPEEMRISVESVWHIAPGHVDQPGVMFAGTTPAGLFRSNDRGETWTSNDAINHHELRPYWQPTKVGAFSLMSIWEKEGREGADVELDGLGARALPNTTSPGVGTLHAIEIDPRDAQHMYLSISAGGCYESLDGGTSWKIFRTRPVTDSTMGRMFISQTAAQAPSNVDPAVEFDVHSMRMDPKNPDRLWAQAHGGVYRTDDRGASWTDVTEGLPSVHGFPIAVTHQQPDAAFVRSYGVWRKTGGRTLR